MTRLLSFPSCLWPNSEDGLSSAIGGERRRQELEEYLTRYLVLHSDDQMCKRWARAMNSARVRGLRIAPADAWVAATAMLLDIPLVTHNGAHYTGIACV
jgi:predicted nucleic acid-binding protein